MQKLLGVAEGELLLWTELLALLAEGVVEVFWKEDEGAGAPEEDAAEKDAAEEDAAEEDGAEDESDADPVSDADDTAEDPSVGVTLADVETGIEVRLVLKQPPRPLKSKSGFSIRLSTQFCWSSQPEVEAGWT